MKLPIVLLIVLIAALLGSFLFWYSTIFKESKPEVATPDITTPPDPIAELCKEFRNVAYKISCDEAVKIALDQAPGKVQNVSIGPVRTSVPSSSGLLERRTVNLWLIDIALANPYFEEKLNKQVNRLQIGLSLDERFDEHYFVYRKPLE